MKLLFDQNLSFKLVNKLIDLYPEAKHVKQLGLHTADDVDVWQFARKHNYLIVSKDEDFHQLSFLYGQPPKVIWIRAGNCSTQAIEALLRAHFTTILTFYQDEQSAFLVLGST